MNFPFNIHFVIMEMIGEFELDKSSNRFYAGNDMRSNRHLSYFKSG